MGAISTWWDPPWPPLRFGGYHPQGLAEFGTSIQYSWLADCATSPCILLHVQAWLYQHLRSLQSTACAELAYGSVPGTWIKLENVRVWLSLFFWQNTGFVMSA